MFNQWTWPFKIVSEIDEYFSAACIKSVQLWCYKTVHDTLQDPTHFILRNMTQQTAKSEAFSIIVCIFANNGTSLLAPSQTYPLHLHLVFAVHTRQFSIHIYDISRDSRMAQLSQLAIVAIFSGSLIRVISQMVPYLNKYIPYKTQNKIFL